MKPLFRMDQACWRALSASSFWGAVFPWRCHGLEEKCPLRGGGFGAIQRRFLTDAERLPHGFQSPIIHKNPKGDMIQTLTNNWSFSAPVSHSAAHGHAVGSIRNKALSPAAAPNDEATISDGTSMLACPFRAYSFWGTVFPWRCHGLEEKCPLRGARSPIIQQTHISGIMNFARH